MRTIKNKIALCVLILQTLIGCKGNEAKHQHHEAPIYEPIALEQYVDSLTEEDSFAEEEDGNDSIIMAPFVIHSFLGKKVLLDNSILDQISAIARKDKMLSYDDEILKIGDVEWGVNTGDYGIALLTDTQPDDPEMKPVVKYLTRIYGKPYEDEEDGFDIKWSSSKDTLDLFNEDCTLVHMRRVHSEEGGTFIFFR